ncbi:MAG: acyl-CoA dehydrogenase family protein [Pseudomonadota bacterium]
MDFTLSDEQSALRETVAKFASAELPKVAAFCEDKHEPVPPDVVKSYADMGFMGLNLPETYGGGGQSHLDAVIVLEELAKISAAVAFPVFESCFGPVLAIAHFAPEALRRRVIPKVCSGEGIVAVAMSEPDAGSALTDLKTHAVLDGDHYVLNGTKRWCSGGGHSDHYVVYCKLSDEPGAKGIGALLVTKPSDGFSFGKKEYLLGFRGIPSADMFFDNVRVPADNLIVPAGGFRQLMEAFDLERCGNTTMSLAIAQSAFDEALAYVQDRRQFGKPLVDFQAVQMSLAEMKMKLDAARLLLYRAVVNAEAGLPSVADSSIAKCFANEAVREVTGKAMQIMGGYGYSTAYPIEQKMRDGWGWGIAGGSIDIQKTNIAAALVGRRFSQRN